MAHVSCAECGESVGEFGRGRRAYIGVDEWEDNEEVVVFCPVCASREFGATELADSDGTD